MIYLFNFIVYMQYVYKTPEDILVCHEMYLHVENGK